MSPGIADYKNRAIPLSHSAPAEGFPMSSVRAIPCRRLALAQQDKAIADLLLKLADECDRGILGTAEWHSVWPSRKSEQPPKAGYADLRFER